ncbi:MAG: beta-N-acetylhexosaminidase, partial [Phocaeicola sp.]
MRKILNLTICLLFLLSCNKKEETPIISIIPMPNKIITNNGVYKLEGKKRIYYQQDESILKVHAYFEDILKRAHVTLEYTSKEDDADIVFITDNEMANEAYLLNVEQDKITIRSNSSASGFFYGVQSLIQLMPPQLYDNNAKLTSISIPKVTIEDSPRFPHRGAMMDVGRNFLTKETVLKFIDAMATYKLNVFHFHLTEDQGWRIEIKKYPRLTEVGSYRSQTQIGHSDYYFPRRYDGKEQQGYYTQEEIKEIVQYAADRFITVIPEIEMPGHASAALASYPEYSCGLGKQYVVRDYFDVFDEVYCPKEITFQFLEDVLTEVMELFPSKYIHIGGDECPKKAWKKCNHCQALMRKNNLKNEEELQSWFIHRIEKFLNSKGRNIIGWDEILEGGLAPNATVMSWRGEAGGIEAAKQQKKVIMTPGETCYFDYYQESPEYAPIAMGGYLLIDKVYNYNPLPEQLTLEEQSYIIGTQANVWGEYIQTPEHFDYMAFPRL